VGEREESIRRAVGAVVRTLIGTATTPAIGLGSEQFLGSAAAAG